MHHKNKINYLEKNKIDIDSIKKIHQEFMTKKKINIKNTAKV